MGETSQMTQIIQKTLDGLTKEKMTSVHTQLIQTKQIIPTEQLQVLGLKEKNHGSQNNKAIEE